MTILGMEIAAFLPMGLAAALSLAAGLSDARSFRIPNILPLLIALLFPIYAWAKGDVAWLAHVGVGVAVLVVGFALYAAKLTGGGDVKLMAALSLWAGLERVFLFLIVTTLAGGLLCLVIVGLAWKRKQGQIGKMKVPYGIAIAVAGLCLFYDFLPLT